MSSCDDSKNTTTMNRGACALIMTSASSSSTRTSSASTLSGSGSRGSGSGSGEGSGFRRSGGKRVTVFTVAPQLLITAVSSTRTATANLLEALQKKRAKKGSAPFDDVVMSAENHVATDDKSNMQAQQQNHSTKIEGKLKISFPIYSSIRDYETSNNHSACIKVQVRYLVVPDFTCAFINFFRNIMNNKTYMCCSDL
jgi:hypothetical protein